jgi:Protein of unknown function (DUF3168)
VSLTAASRDRLSADAAVAAIAGDRVYRDERRQGDPLPALVIHLISDSRPTVHGGAQALRRSRLQLDCLGDSRAVADALAEVAIAAMTGADTVAGVIFSRSFVANVRGLTTRKPSQPTVFACAVDLLVWWRPAA